MIQTDHPIEDRQTDLTVWLIRHGESEAYIKAAAHSEEIRLTEAGKRQAEEIADMLQSAPDLVISSSYVRAWETALPTLKRFPGIPYQIWPVHEFTYLGSLAGKRSTKAERHPKVEEYWRRCDPTYRDGNCESFAGFIQRARETIDQIKRQKGFVAIFTHEQFMRAVQGWLEGQFIDGRDPTKEDMHQFRRTLLTEQLHYGAIQKYPDAESRSEYFFQREYSIPLLARLTFN